MAIQPLGIDNVLVGVGDLDQAVAFYADLLGLGLRFRLDDAGLALFDIGAEAPGLLVRVAEDQPAGGRMRVWFEVADARAAAEVLRTAGATLLADPFPVQTGWTVEIADPWGTVIGLTDYTRQPERGRST